MTYTIYRRNDIQIVWKPSTYPTADTTNAADETWYYFPVDTSMDATITINRRTKAYARHSGNASPYTTKIHRGRQNPITLSIEGGEYYNILDYYARRGITTTGASTPYTHTFNQSTQTLTYPPPVIDILMKIPNHGDAADTILLFKGCGTTDKTRTMALHTKNRTAYSFEAAREVTGTNLTTPGWPSRPSVRVFDWTDNTFTFTKGGVALHVQAEKITTKMTIKGIRHLYGNDDEPVEITSPVQTHFEVEATLRLREDIIANLRLDPETANNLDFSVKSMRNDASDDYEESWADGLMELLSMDWEDDILKYKVKGYYNPDEASGNYTSVEVNPYDNTQYEGA